jgi:hypothetical protein
VRSVTSASTRDPFFFWPAARPPVASRARAARAACCGLPIRPTSAAAGAVRLSASSARRPSRPSRPPPSRPHLHHPLSSLLLVAAARHLFGCPPIHPGRLLLRPSAAGCCAPPPVATARFLFSVPRLSAAEGGCAAALFW